MFRVQELQKEQFGCSDPCEQINDLQKIKIYTLINKKQNNSAQVLEASTGFYEIPGSNLPFWDSFFGDRGQVMGSRPHTHIYARALSPIRKKLWT